MGLSGLIDRQCDGVRQARVVRAIGVLGFRIEARLSQLLADSGPKRRAVDHSARDGTGNITISWLPAQTS